MKLEISLERERFDISIGVVKIIFYRFIIAICAYVIMFSVTIINNKRTIAIGMIVIIVGALFCFIFRISMLVSIFFKHL